MSHRHAPLTETGRLRLARCVVEDGWPLRRAAERFQVSHSGAGRGTRAREPGTILMRGPGGAERIGPRGAHGRRRLSTSSGERSACS